MIATDSLDTLIVYRRPGCHLCDDAEVMLRDELESRARTGLTTPGVVIVDITAEPALLATYELRIPVLALGTNEVDLVTRPRQIRDLLERSLPSPT